MRSGFNTPTERIAIVATMKRSAGGTGHARIINPLRVLAEEPDVSVQIVTDDVFPDLAPGTAGICILHRPILAGVPGLDVIRHLLAKGYMIVSDFDVNMDVFPMMQAPDILAFRGVHAVQTSNERLADVLRSKNPEIAIFADAMPALPKIANFLAPGQRTLFFGPLNPAPDGQPWLGSLVPWLNAAAASVGDRLKFSIVHDRTLFDALDTTHKSFVPACDYETYLRLLGQSEIAFMPLANTAFDRTKSDLEFVEAGAHRVVALASPIVYGATIQDTRTGLLFHTPQQLLHRLAWLVVNPEAVKIADAARAWVAEHRILASQTKARLTWYRSLIARRTELTDALHARVPELAAKRTGVVVGPKPAGSIFRSEEGLTNSLSVHSSQDLVDQVTRNLSRSADYVDDSHQLRPPLADKVRLIAFYLPQYHPIPENDDAWGKGFTEWTNVTASFPKFPGHYQPHLPIGGGFYDLRVVDNLRQQAAMARKYGLHGFCFHHYWFSGKQLLEGPIKALLKNRDIDLPFCINWANENWTRGWDGGDSKILQYQRYGKQDAIDFARSVTDILRDERYIRVNGRPLLLIYRPELVPDISSTIKIWRAHFQRVGVGDPYIAICRVVVNDEAPEKFGVDAVVGFPPHPGGWHLPNINEKFIPFDKNFRSEIKDYDKLVASSLEVSASDKPYKYFHGVCPGFDNEARRPGRSVIFHGSSPSKYGAWLEEVARRTLAENSEDSKDERIVFINAWNEWGEGAHLEPDRHYGYAYLAQTARVINGLTEQRGRCTDRLWQNYTAITVPSGEAQPPVTVALEESTASSATRVLCGEARMGARGGVPVSRTDIDSATKIHMLYVDHMTPRPDEDSGSVCAYNFMKVLRELGFEVTFFGWQRPIHEGRYTEALEAIGIQCLHTPHVTDLGEWLQAYGHNLSVAILARVAVASACLPMFKLHAPHVKIIFNTVDLHFLREQRHAHLLNSQEARTQAIALQQRELAITASSDATIVVSPIEAQLLAELAPKACVYQIPIFRDIPGRSAPFDKRQGLIFIGGFNHEPNVDAINYFLDDIWPLVRSKIPGVELHIVGSNMPSALAGLAGLDVVGHGQVAELGDVFSRCRVSIAPLRFGAGQKGKIVTSLSYGVPVIGTSVAVEGMHLRDGSVVRVGDTPESFAQAVADVYLNEGAWQRISDEGLAHVTAHFRYDGAKQAIRDMMAAVLVTDAVDWRTTKLR